MRMNRLVVVAVAALCALSSGATEMKLMSFNVCHCSGMDGKIDIARTAARIRAEDPDFACLQELDWYTARSGVVDQPAELARLTGLHATFAREIFFQGGQFGVAVLSREKPKDVVQIPLPGGTPRVLLLCTFADCIVGTFHPAALAEPGTDVLIRKALDSAVDGKPVFLNGERMLRETSLDAGKGSGCEPVVRTMTVSERMLLRPALVPAPVKLTMRAGTYRMKTGAVTEAVFAKRTVDASLPKEGYRLEIGESGVSVAAADDAGFFYALQTLKQLAYSSWGRLAFPCCTIEDAPRFGWRGVHWDDSRHFFGKAAVKRTLDLMAQHKLNVFHWHLTDSQGWRFPVKKHPELARDASSRPYSTNQKNLADLYEDGTYGPYAYSESDIREIVAYAAERQIRIIPEIDVPGHSRAALLVHPELLCFPKGSPDAPKGAVANVFCLGNDESLKLFDDVFEAVCELFPDELVHIGGDEVNKVNWEACPRCRARMKALGLKDGKELQSWQMNRTAALLAKRGKRVVGWDEMLLDGKAPPNSIVMSWRGSEGGIAAAKAGLEAVMTPHVSCYFDYDQCVRGDPAVYPWFTERLPVEKVYAYEPLEGIPAGQRGRILGGQCCNWSEYTCNETELQWKMWPRTCALSEVLWSPAECRDFGDFSKRMETHRLRLIDGHVNCAPMK